MNGPGGELRFVALIADCKHRLVKLALAVVELEPRQALTQNLRQCLIGLSRPRTYTCSARPSGNGRVTS